MLLLDQVIRFVSCASGVTKQMLTFSKGGAPVTRAGSIVDLVKDSAELTLRGAKAKAILRDVLVPGYF